MTRPADAARRFAAEAEAHGFEALVEPMLTIQPLAIDAADRAGLTGAQAILLTSAAAVAPLAAAIDPLGIAGPAILTVGGATAAAAQAAGFPNVASAEGDVEALAALAIARLDAKGGAVMHAAGERRAGDLVGNLREAGFDARVVPLYRATPASRLSARTTAAFRAGKIDCAAFFSPQTARIFARLATDAGIVDDLGRVTAAALSQNVADAFEYLTWRRLLTADQPTTAALLAKLVASISDATPDNGAG